MTVTMHERATQAFDIDVQTLERLVQLGGGATYSDSVKNSIALMKLLRRFADKDGNILIRDSNSGKLVSVHAYEERAREM